MSEPIKGRRRPVVGEKTPNYPSVQVVRLKALGIILPPMPIGWVVNINDIQEVSYSDQFGKLRGKTYCVSDGTYPVYWDEVCYSYQKTAQAAVDAIVAMSFEGVPSTSEAPPWATPTPVKVTGPDGVPESPKVGQAIVYLNQRFGDSVNVIQARELDKADVYVSEMIVRFHYYVDQRDVVSAVSVLVILQALGMDISNLLDGLREPPKPAHDTVARLRAEMADAHEDVAKAKQHNSYLMEALEEAQQANHTLRDTVRLHEMTIDQKQGVIDRLHGADTFADTVAGDTDFSDMMQGVSVHGEVYHGGVGVNIVPQVGQVVSDDYLTYSTVSSEQETTISGSSDAVCKVLEIISRLP